jgi:predicted transcriptional regulator
MFVAMTMTRDRILEALQDLPADATVDDAIERLVFLAKIDAGLAELDEGKGIPHAEVKRRLGM